MKKTIFIAILTVFISCKKDTETEATTSETTTQIMPINDAMAENAVIYEANIRQYSPEGTFNAFTKDIPVLKQLGVKIIWLMPIYPISMQNRKATGDLSIEDIKDPEERKKYLGSAYAISDYTAVNPDYGTKEDFRKLIKTAHDNGIYVILDWVPNHTGWDHKWIKEHPEYYHKNAKGEVTDPINPETGESWGWTDVAHLDYANAGLHDAMRNEMMYWVKEENVDGFRCDVADNVPTPFWEKTIPELRKIKPVFMLMESNKDYLFKDGLFDMGYGWEAHHVMNDINKGTKTVADFDKTIQKIADTYERNDFFMNFTTNHDENSWNGTEYERMGDGVEAFTVLTYMMPGLPLIYTGQEYDLKHRLKFFEKDSIPKNKGKMFGIFEKLGQLKSSNPALNGGKNSAAYQRIPTTDDEKILAFQREKSGAKLVYVANLSKDELEFELGLEGTFRNYMTGEAVTLSKGQKQRFKPWEYWVLAK